MGSLKRLFTQEVRLLSRIVEALDGVKYKPGACGWTRDISADHRYPCHSSQEIVTFCYCAVIDVVSLEEQLKRSVVEDRERRENKLLCRIELGTLLQGLCRRWLVVCTTEVDM
jgi:hypothetical protein